MRPHRNSFLIDRAGGTVHRHDLVWHRTFDGTISGSEADVYAITNLGWIAVETKPRSVSIQLRAASVSPMAVVALIQWVSDQDRMRVMLTVHRRQAEHRLFGEGHQLLRRLVELLWEIEGSPRDRFTRREVGPEASSPRPRLARLATMWADGLREASGAFQSSRFLDALGERHILVQASDGLDRLTVREISEGYHSISREWLHKNQDVQLVDQYDVHYGWWIAEAYREALLAGKPKIEQITARISRPQRPSLHLDYSRALLPLSGPRGQRMLLSTTIIDRAVEV